MTTWAESLDALISDPGAALKEDGYAFEDALPAGELNWLLRDLYRRGGGSLATVADGIESAGLAEGDTFSVRPRAGTATGDNINSEDYDVGVIVITDGSRIYAAGDSANDTLVCFDSRTFGVPWRLVCPGIITCMCHWAGYLYVGLLATEGDVFVVRVNALTGAIVEDAVLPADLGAPRRICANATAVVMLFEDDEFARVYHPTTLAAVGTFNHRAAIHDVACDADYIYIAGAPAGAGGSVGHGGKTVVKISLAARTYAGGVVGDTATTLSWIFVDDRAIYVFTDGGVGDDYSYAYGKVDLGELWPASLEHNLTSGTVPAMTDEGFVLSYGASNLAIVDKWSGLLKWVQLAAATTDSYSAVCSDGMVLYAIGAHADFSRFIGSYVMETRPRVFGRVNDAMLARRA